MGSVKQGMISLGRFNIQMLSLIATFIPGLSITLLGMCLISNGEMIEAGIFFLVSGLSWIIAELIEIVRLVGFGKIIARITGTISGIAIFSVGSVTWINNEFSTLASIGFIIVGFSIALWMFIRFSYKNTKSIIANNENITSMAMLFIGFLAIMVSHSFNIVAAILFPPSALILFKIVVIWGRDNLDADLDFGFDKDISIVYDAGVGVYVAKIFTGISLFVAGAGMIEPGGRLLRGRDFILGTQTHNIIFTFGIAFVAIAILMIVGSSFKISKHKRLSMSN